MTKVNEIRIPWTWWEIFYFILAIWWSFLFMLEVLFLHNLIWIGLALFFALFSSFSFGKERKKREVTE